MRNQINLSINSEKSLAVHDDIHQDRITFVLPDGNPDNILIVTPNGGFKVNIDELTKVVDVIYDLKTRQEYKN